MNTANYVLVGDAWTAGTRDLTGLGVPLTAALTGRHDDQTIPVVRDLTGSGGLCGALRRVATAGPNAFGVDPTIVVLLGLEDAEQDPLPEEWLAGYTSLVKQLSEVGRGVLLVVPPKVGSGQPTGNYGRKARRWSDRVPKQGAARAVSVLGWPASATPIDVLDVPEDIERADDVWLRPLGVRSLAQLIAHTLVG